MGKRKDYCLESVGVHIFRSVPESTVYMLREVVPGMIGQPAKLKGHHLLKEQETFR